MFTGTLVGPVVVVPQMLPSETPLCMFCVANAVFGGGSQIVRVHARGKSVERAMRLQKGEQVAVSGDVRESPNGFRGGVLLLEASNVQRVKEAL